jgi:hypothetical protein
VAARVGGTGAEAYEAARDLAAIEIFQERSVRLAVQIDWLAKAVCDAAASDADLVALLRQIEAVGRELISRIACPDQAAAVNRLLSGARKLRTVPAPASSALLDDLLAAAGNVAVQLAASLK